jgi:TetR/AcrR family transcriptional regulator
MDLFARKGFAGTSMRDLASATGLSVSGLYHHVPGKSQLLHQLQEDAFRRLLRPLSSLPPSMTPEEKLGLLIQNHVSFFAHHITEMKVLAHESDALGGELGRKMHARRRRYYRLCLRIVSDILRKSRRVDIDVRVCTMTLFGMINWIYTWYRPTWHGDPDTVARQMTEIFLRGIRRDRRRVVKRG